MENLKDVIEDNVKLMAYLKTKSENHRKYKAYYEKLEYAEYVLKNNAMLINNTHKWNDVLDKKCFEDKNYVYFVKSFSYGDSENVAMWMLYGKNNKNCGMLEINNTLFKELYNAKSIEVLDSPNGNVICTLEDNFFIERGDVLYQGKKNVGFDYARAREYAYSKIDYKKKIGILVKKYPWSYENETRLIVKIKKGLFDTKDSTCIRLKFKTKLSNKNIYNSPRTTLKNNYQRSDLFGEIDW